MQINVFKYNKLLKSSVLSIDGTLTGFTIPGQNGPDSKTIVEGQHIQMVYHHI